MTAEVTSKNRQFSIRFGPATTAGIDWCGETSRTRPSSLCPQPNLENIILFNGRAVTGINGMEFAFLTDINGNLSSLWYFLRCDAQDGRSTTLMLEEAA